MDILVTTYIMDTENTLSCYDLDHNLWLAISDLFFYSEKNEFKLKRSGKLLKSVI